MAFTVSTTSAAKKLMEPPQQPQLLMLRATADTYIRQGSADVVATTNDVLLEAGAYFPLCVEASDDNYLAVITASGSSIVYATLVSSIDEICGDSDPLIGAIFGGGQTAAIPPDASASSAMYKYIFDTNTIIASGVSLSSPGTGLTILAAAGDANAARFMGGQWAQIVGSGEDTDIIQKYVYATDTIATTGALDTPRNGCVANGNSTAGYVAKGSRNGNSTSVTTAVVAWATDTTSIIGGWATNNGGEIAYTFGIATIGYWALQQRVQKLIYSTVTFSQNGTALPSQRGADAQNGFGNTVNGWMIGGVAGTTGAAIIATSIKYTYVGDTNAASTSLSTARGGGAGTSNDTLGIICSGDINSGYAVTSSVTFTFASETEGAGGTALAATQFGAATSPSYGGLQ